MGATVNCTYHPVSKGVAGLLMLSAHAAVRLAWTALTVPREQYVWFALRNPRVLRSTLIRFADEGDRDGLCTPRCDGTIWLDDVTAYFDYGLAASARPNDVTFHRVPTSVCLHRYRPFTVRQIVAVAALPRGFDIVHTIRSTRAGVVLTAASGHRLAVSLDVKFLSR